MERRVAHAGPRHLALHIASKDSCQTSALKAIFAEHEALSLTHSETVDLGVSCQTAADALTYVLTTEQLVNHEVRMLADVWETQSAHLV